MKKLFSRFFKGVACDEELTTIRKRLRWTLTIVDFSEYIYILPGSLINVNRHKMHGRREYKIKNEVIGWLNENIGEEHYDWLAVADTDKIAKFYFPNDTDAVAFKLRWS